MSYQDRIDATTSLNELCDLLNELQGKLDDAAEVGTSMWKLDELVDLTTLPTFGGDEPDDMDNVWSWDETDKLVHDNEWKIVPRDDYDREGREGGRK